MKRKVYAYLHTHWDREWYREFEEFRLRLVEVFDDVLKKLSSDEIPSFYFDGQTSALEDYLEINPENCEIVKKFINDKRLYIGPYFCSTDSFLVDSESLIKNLQIGLAYSKRFGCSNFIAYHADTFGHSQFIPQIIKYFNIPYALFWRGLAEINSEFLFKNLKSINLVEGYFHDYLSLDISYEKKAEMLKRTLDKISKFSSGDILLPLGADHLAISDNIKEQILAINNILTDYEIHLSSPFDYVKLVDKNFKINHETEFRDTKRNFILPGVYSSRIDLKRNNVKLQWEISRLTQPLQAIASFLGYSKNFQSEVDYLHKELIKNHAHDSIYGCSVDSVHEENNLRFKKVAQASHAVINSVKRDLYKSDCLSVINLSDFDFKGALKLKTDKKLDKKFNAQLISKQKGFPFLKVYDISQIPITEDYTTIYEYLIDIKNVQSFSLQQIKEYDICRNSSLKISTTSIENNKVGLFIQDGKINIKDKTNNKIFYDFIKFVDRADIGDSYNFGALKNDRPVYSRVLSSKIIEKGHIRSILEIKTELEIPIKSTVSGRSCSLKRHVLKLWAILENQNDFIEFQLNWVNKSTDHILQVEFNMEENVCETVSDDLAGYTKRVFDSDYDIYSCIPAPKGIELKHNTAPFQKLLFVQDVGIITEGLQEYEVCKDKLRLTVLRATGTISNPHNPTRGTPAGPPLSAPALQMLGDNSARFALGFNDNIQKFEKSVSEFFNSSMILQSALDNLKLFDSGNENILINTIKLNDNNDLILRFVNKSHIAQHIQFKTLLKYSAIFIADAMENPIQKYSDHIVSGNSFITLLIKSDI